MAPVTDTQQRDCPVAENKPEFGGFVLSLLRTQQRFNSAGFGRHHLSGDVPKTRQCKIDAVFVTGLNPNKQQSGLFSVAGQRRHQFWDDLPNWRLSYVNALVADRNEKFAPSQNTREVVARAREGV